MTFSKLGGNHEAHSIKDALKITFFHLTNEELCIST